MNILAPWAAELAVLQSVKLKGLGSVTRAAFVIAATAHAAAMLCEASSEIAGAEHRAEAERLAVAFGGLRDVAAYPQLAHPPTVHRSGLLR